MTVRIVTLVLAMWVWAPIASAEPVPLDKRIQFHGRWDRRQPDRAITVNGGSYILARFEGAAITAKFEMSRNKPPLPTLAWRIDDSTEWRESEMAPSLELEKDMKPGPHTIEFVMRGFDEHQPRWTEPLTASATFLGFDLPKQGKLLDPPAEAKLKIEFLGDSITEGVRVYPVAPGRETWAWQTDGRMAWAAQTATQLKASWRQVGFGAQGLTHGGSGGSPASLDAFDWFYEGAPRDDWQADVVVINQGTNDGGAPSEKFRPLYAEYLRKIRKAYPKAKILALRPFNGAHADDIRAEVDALAPSDTAGVKFVDTAGWLETTDFTDGVHPNAGAGAKVAAKLAPLIADPQPR